MSENLLKIASEILGVTVDEVRKNSKTVSEENAFFCWNPVRGGLQMIIRETEEKLVLGSAFSFEKILAMFQEGKRN
jgi:hypothetical protein